jgi:cell division protein FtsW
MARASNSGAGRPGNGRVASLPMDGQRPRISNLREKVVNLARTLVGGQSVLFIVLLATTGGILVFGLVMMLSSSSIDSIQQSGSPLTLFGRQLLVALAGVAGLFFFSILSRSWNEKLAVLIPAAFIFLQFIAAFFGRAIGGNRQWIALAGFTIQPSEFLKLGLIMLVSLFMYARLQFIDEPRLFLTPILISFGAVVGLILYGSDLGTSIVISLIVLCMLWMSGMSLRQWAVTAIALGIVAAIFATFGNRAARINAWLHQDYSVDTGTYAWQSTHGVWAVANGHIFGAGLGMSSLKWSWLPESSNDYIFAIIAEELGLIGAVFTIGLFVTLIICIFKIALRSADYFDRFMALGIGFWFLIQSFINIAVVLGLLPVLGVPLPLVSQGGSAMLSGLCAIGVVLGVERRNHLHIDGGRRPVRVARASR